LIVAPTTYNSVTEKELIDSGASIVIYANHLLRSSYRVMFETAKIILRDESTRNAEKQCQPIQELLEIGT